ncbi:AAA family ATPase, partial [Mangrovimonas sp. AS39]|nr:AAA family ATPase [Mangrovimonas futianensis]
MDIGRLFNSLVGSSEARTREALKQAEAFGTALLWVDEIEKGLSGTQSSGQTDGGTTSRVFGTILTWMQEHKSNIIVIATANDVGALPPELLRRFNEIFFV